VIELGWQPRPVPLRARAAVGLGPIGVRLAGAIGGRPLEVVRFEGALVLIGAEAELPWVEGVLYLGIDPRAPGLLVPTHRAPTVPIDLLARALIAGRGLAPPIALVHEPALALALGGMVAA
jgi:hypothetical protein